MTLTVKVALNTHTTNQPTKISSSGNVLKDTYFLSIQQLTLMAEDGSPDPRTANTTVSISVERNLEAPRFQLPAGETQYVFNVNEDEAPGFLIDTLRAVDADPQVTFTLYLICQF